MYQAITSHNLSSTNNGSQQTFSRRRSAAHELNYRPGTQPPNRMSKQRRFEEKVNSRQQSWFCADYSASIHHQTIYLLPLPPPPPLRLVYQRYHCCAELSAIIFHPNQNHPVRGSFSQFGWNHVFKPFSFIAALLPSSVPATSSWLSAIKCIYQVAVMDICSWDIVFLQWLKWFSRLLTDTASDRPFLMSLNCLKRKQQCGTFNGGSESNQTNNTSHRLHLTSLTCFLVSTPPRLLVLALMMVNSRLN